MTTDAPVQYVDAVTLGLRGQPFPDAPTPYRRLPAAAAGQVPEKLIDLAEMSAGLYVDFISNSDAIYARLELLSTVGDHHAAPSSVDLYLQKEGSWLWAGILRDVRKPVTESSIARGLPAYECRYRMYLPFATKVESLAIGVEAGATLKAAPVDARRPIVCYGTSIVHGYNAGRPGLTMPSQLGRRLNHPTINLGFAGNARMDPSLIPFLQQLDPEIMTIDCLPNMDPALVLERAPGFIRAMREKWPAVPLLIVENLVYQATYAMRDKRSGWGPKNDALKQVFAELLRDGVTGLHYLCGEQMLGNDGEATTDGTHPNDIGMKRMTDAYISALMPMMPEGAGIGGSQSGPPRGSRHASLDDYSGHCAGESGDPTDAPISREQIQDGILFTV